MMLIPFRSTGAGGAGEGGAFAMFVRCRGEQHLNDCNYLSSADALFCCGLAREMDSSDLRSSTFIM